MAEAPAVDIVAGLIDVQASQVLGPIFGLARFLSAFLLKRSFRVQSLLFSAEKLLPQGHQAPETCSRKRRMNSSAPSVIVLCRVPPLVR